MKPTFLSLFNKIKCELLEAISPNKKTETQTPSNTYDFLFNINCLTLTISKSLGKKTSNTTFLFSTENHLLVVNLHFRANS